MILRDKLAQEATKKLNIASLSIPVQEEIISRVGQNIIKRVSVEIFKTLPKDKRPEFEEFIGSGDVDGLYAFLKPLVPDLDAFIERETEKEIKLTKELVEKTE